LFSFFQVASLKQSSDRRTDQSSLEKDLRDLRLKHEDLIHSNQVKDQRLEALLKLNEDRNGEYDTDMTSLKNDIKVCSHVSVHINLKTGFSNTYLPLAARSCDCTLKIVLTQPSINNKKFCRLKRVSHRSMHKVLYYFQVFDFT
jgi:hypothetical protein